MPAMPRPGVVVGYLPLSSCRHDHVVVVLLLHAMS